eukprot:SAG31_NODE_567_length_14028_cov_4.022328_18_plen_593_part_00
MVVAPRPAGHRRPCVMPLKVNTMVAPLALVVALHLAPALPGTAAAAQPPAGHDIPDTTAATAARLTAQMAQHLPADATVDRALRLVGVDSIAVRCPRLQFGTPDPLCFLMLLVSPCFEFGTAQQVAGEADLKDSAGRKGRAAAASAAAGVAGLVLQRQGFFTALDLQLLRGAPEAAELMDELRANGGLRIADRAKIRLLIGDRAHLTRFMLPTAAHDAGAQHSSASHPCRSTHRLLQNADDSSSNTLSLDTIAIVLSVFCGVCGYLLQAWTADKHNQHAAELQREHDQEARERQQEHEKIQAQIRRTERWVDDCCVPVHQALNVYLHGTRSEFVGWLAVELQASHADVFAEMYKNYGYSMGGIQVADNGVVQWANAVALDPTAPKGQTWVAPTMLRRMMMAHVSPATVDVTVQDSLSLWKGPYVRELPQAFFDAIAMDAGGSLAESYRGYIRHEVKPTLDRVISILHTHFPAIEVPSVEWLIETFPGHVKTDTVNAITNATIAYARAWDRVLAQWDVGRFDMLFPPNHMMPYLGIYRVIAWSRARGEAKQQELIGMSANMSTTQHSRINDMRKLAKQNDDSTFETETGDDSS